MTATHGFELIRKQQIPELKIEAEYYRHDRTGAELLSLLNDDENKVFGITFRTPPVDSTGVAHILEHSVLCGSRKYPVKEPFVELLKGSLQTFLNAMTYPDKTCYPVASQNLQDFYNLIDVYLDAVFYPHISPFIFQQEGWHFEMETPDSPLCYKGVVFNEMKGAYSSPDNLLAEYSQQSLFPDNTYGLDSGGKPDQIPNLTFEQFKGFHSRYYHPSNARIFFYGDDNPEQRLRLINDYLKEFERIEIDSTISLQPPFEKPRRLTRTFVAGEGDEKGSRGMLTVNWLINEARDSELTFALNILEYILLGMPGSPLRKALIESNLGEDLAGVGLGDELRQMYFSTGLKGIDIRHADKIEALIMESLDNLSKKSIDPHTIEAALNTIEFNLRENNTGSFPRGLMLMLRSLTTWLYDDDPLALVAFEAPLERIKSNLKRNNSLFEDMINRFLLNNPHRVTLILKPDPGLEKKERLAEQEKLEKNRAAMGTQEIGNVITTTRKLRQMQEKPDTPEALATIPSLKLVDLDREEKQIPLTSMAQKETQILYHDLFTNGIAYLDVGFNIHTLPRKYLPYVRLFGRALLEIGTETEDYVTLTQRISRKTGGIHSSFFNAVIKDTQKGTAWMFLRGKAVIAKTDELLNIIRDVLLTVRLDNRERFRQMVLEAKARQERQLIPGGHQVVNLRLRAHFSEADWAAEQMNGVSYIFFLRKLTKAVDEDWMSVLTDLEEMRNILVNRNSMILNITLDDTGWSHFQPQVNAFLNDLPAKTVNIMKWSRENFPEFEGLTIPAQVNYVGKGAGLYELGYSFHGSARVISRFLRNTWLWDRVRVQGGAYGAFCLIDRLSGVLTFVSYRDPNLLKTLDVFDQSVNFLRQLDLNHEELEKSIIGTIGDIDKYMLPDAAGYTSLLRNLTGETDRDRQQVREEVLGTTIGHFKAFADVLEEATRNGLVKVLGSRSAIEETMAERRGWLNVLKVL